MGDTAAEESALCGAGGADNARAGGEGCSVSRVCKQRCERLSVVGVQPSLGRVDGAAGGNACTAEPLSTNALGPLLACKLRRACGVHSAARRSGELATGAATILGKFLCAGCAGASRGGGAYSGVCRIRMCSAGGQAARGVGAICVSTYVRGGRGAATDAQPCACRWQGRGVDADESRSPGDVWCDSRMGTLAGT